MTGRKRLGLNLGVVALGILVAYRPIVRSLREADASHGDINSYRYLVLDLPRSEDSIVRLTESKNPAVLHMVLHYFYNGRPITAKLQKAFFDLAGRKDLERSDRAAAIVAVAAGPRDYLQQIGVLVESNDPATRLVGAYGISEMLWKGRLTDDLFKYVEIVKSDPDPRIRNLQWMNPEAPPPMEYHDSGPAIPTRS